ncbi:hypothetical protein GCM10025858_36540 [Alicyclobacillus sacchari]|nr:hypothetical protein GCM10025858_36540 [Alicyclobacillus sacchari]
MTIDIHEYIEVCKRDMEPGQRELDRIALLNQERVLEAFWRHRVAQSDLAGSTGYGLSDVGRDKFEAMFAEVFGAEAYRAAADCIWHARHQPRDVRRTPTWRRADLCHRHAVRHTA